MTRATHTMKSILRTAVVFVVSVATLAVAALVGLPARPAAAAATPLTVVAVGDSYASGEGAMGAGWTNAACHRSSLAGPANAAGLLNGVRSTSFTSLACTGATTASLIGSGGQLSALPSGPIDALTMSIGGNDIGFAGIVSTCMLPPPSDCTGLDPAVTSSITTTLPPLLDGVLAAVPSTVSNVFVTEYPDSTTGLFGLRCGNPLSPSSLGMEGVMVNEAEWASTRVIAPLNAALAAAVTRANALPRPRPQFHFVTGISARYASHGYCAGFTLAFWNGFSPRFVNTPIDSLASQSDIFGTMHPNAMGQAATGAALFDAMRFLLDPARVSASTPSLPVAGVPTPITVTVTNTAGRPLPGAVVAFDGVTAGVTDPTGTLSTTWTFNAAGNRTVTADLNPYSVGSATIAVTASKYTINSSPAPIPLGTLPQLTLSATDSATNQLVAGTFTVSSRSGTFTVSSGGSVANVTISDTRQTTRVCEPNEWDKWVCGVHTIVTCPTIYFVPALPAYNPADASYLITCTESA
ncbi:MAG TPA: hypothetical protein VHI95_12595 [Acidimicrobiales bacterium]|nr:hypothetical protein [Acidimicrobiales bacterium]